MNTIDDRRAAFQRLREDLSKMRDILAGENLHALPGILTSDLALLAEIESSDLSIAEQELREAEERVGQTTAHLDAVALRPDLSGLHGAETAHGQALDALLAAQIRVRKLKGE